MTSILYGDVRHSRRSGRQELSCVDWENTTETRSYYRKENAAVTPKLAS